ncbi:MAG: hypothetical protein QM754_18075 [Tepidisphaeraceae bacterium]
MSKTQAGYQAASTTTLFNDRNETVSATTNGVTTAYAYDADGNLLTRGSDSFAWDLRGRMKSATPSSSAQIGIVLRGEKRVLVDNITQDHVSKNATRHSYGVCKQIAW